MSKIAITTSIEMFNYGRTVIAQARREIVEKLIKAAAQEIKEKSNGKHQAQIKYLPGGAMVVEPITADDPTGQKVLQVEQETKAYAKAAAMLSDKVQTLGIINKD